MELYKKEKVSTLGLGLFFSSKGGAMNLIIFIKLDFLQKKIIFEIR
jgi:hypothetical protein